jgi:hypothetical protein
MSRPFRLWLGLVVTLSIVGFTPTPSFAAGTCTGASSNYFDGFGQDYPNHPIDYQGAYGTLVTRAPGLCAGDSTLSNFSNAWTMIAGAQQPSGSCYGEWAQSGFIRRYVSGGGANIRHFAQIASCATLQTHFSTTYIAENTTHSYQSTYGTACSCLTSYVDGQGYYVSAFDPYGTWHAPLNLQFVAETSYREDDVSGTAAAHEQFRSLKGQLASTHALTSTPCNIFAAANSNPSKWSASRVACDALDVWSN